MDTNSRIQVAVLKLQNKEYPLYKGLNMIGRNKAATVNIVNLNVSQNHAVIIEVDETRHYISDMNSSNGTSLHGTKLKPLQLYDLNDDSHIIIGNVDAKYFKLSQSVVVSDTSMQRLNSSQSMSQSMYACNTQLITDESTSDNDTQNERRLYLCSLPPPPKFVPEPPNTESNESQALDIHEIPTQVMEYPERKSPLPPSDLHSAASKGVEGQLVHVNIHEEVTQVVDLPETIERNEDIPLPVQKEVEYEMPPNQENNAAIHVADNIHAAHLDEHSEATIFGGQVPITQHVVSHNQHRYHDSQEPSTSTAHNNQQKIINKSFQIINRESVSNIVVEETLDNISSISDDLLADAPDFSVGELETSLDEEMIPGTKKPLGKQRLKFDSPQEGEMEMNRSNEFKSSDIEDCKKTVKKLESDDNAETNKVENDTEVTEDIITTKKKPLRRLDSTQESDSDTDIECSPSVGDNQHIKPISKSRRAMIDSDTDNASENKENIKNYDKIVNNSVKFESQGSDSDTDIEDEKSYKVVNKAVDSVEKEITETTTNKVKVTAADSKDNAQINCTTKEIQDTNQFDIAKVENDDEKETVINSKPWRIDVDDITSETSANIVNKYRKTESACETAEKADASDRNIDVECYISSENGIGGFNDSDCIPATQDAFALAFNYDKKSEKINADCSEDSFKLGLTELMEGSQNSERLRKWDRQVAEEQINEEIKPPCDAKVDLTRSDQGKEIKTTGVAESADLTTQKIQEACEEIEMNSQKGEEEEEEVYIMPTQKADIPSTSTENKDFKVPSKKFSFKKKALQLEQSITTMLSTQSDDMFMMPTQKLNEDGDTHKGIENNDDDDDDEIYISPTQVVKGNEKKEVDDTVYILPTQKMSAQMTDSAFNIEQRDVVLNNFNTEQLETDKNINITHGDFKEFVAATQVSISAKIVECDIRKDSHENCFDLPTQVFEKPDESPTKILGFQKPEGIESKASFEKKSAQNPAETLKQNNAVHDEDRPETLSQIDRFIKQPQIRRDQKDEVVSCNRKKSFATSSVTLKKKNTTNANKNVSRSSTYSAIRSKRKKSCDSNTKEKNTDGAGSIKLQTGAGENKKIKNDSPEMIATTGIKSENKNEEVATKSSKIRFTRSRSGGFCESDITEMSVNKKESVSKLRKGKSKEKSDSKLGVESTERGRKGSPNSTTSDAIGGNKVEEKEAHVAKIEAEVANIDSRLKRRKSVAGSDENVALKTASDIKRMTRNRSTDIEQTKTSSDSKAASNRKGRDSSDSNERTSIVKPEQAVEKQSSRTRRKNVNNLRMIPEREAAQDAGNVEIDSPGKTESVSRNKRKMDAFDSKIDEKPPLMEDNDDLKDFCVSISKPKKMKGSKKSSDNELVLASTLTALHESSTTSKCKRQSGRKTASKNATSTCSDGDHSCSSSKTLTPRKEARSGSDLSDQLSTPEKNKRKQKPKVVFTMLDSPQMESYIKHLGGSVVDNVDASNVLVTGQVKRSLKLLTAVGQGKPICSPEWIKASKNAREFLDPWDHILIDQDAESKWNFSLKESLERASRKKLFENYVFQVMVTNAADVLKGAIQCCGGKCVTKKPPGDGVGDDAGFVVVATSDQRSRFKKVQAQAPNAIVVEPEAVFDGVLRQEIRFSRHLLS